MKRQRRSFTAEFKQEAASLVLDQQYSVLEASRSLDVGENVLRRWVNQLRKEREGITPKGKALSPDQQRIQELEKRVRDLETEKRILKKATVDSIDQCNTPVGIWANGGSLNEAYIYNRRKRMDFRRLEVGNWIQ